MNREMCHFPFLDALLCFWFYDLIYLFKHNLYKNAIVFLTVVSLIKRAYADRYTSP
jgi:hypothetical protein